MIEPPDPNPSGATTNLGRPEPVPQPQPFPADTAAAGVSMPGEIGGYRIQRVLGSGGMATVYAAMQQQPRRVVALKMMKAGLIDSASDPRRADTAARRFKREIEILGKLHHPYIAQVYEAGVHDPGGDGRGTPFFVMEYISGAKNIIEHTAAQQLHLRDRLKLFVKVCAAVEHGHRNKVIHRDLKPSNILIDQYGEPKVIDFGVAHAAEIDLASQPTEGDSEGPAGTLRYMAPEQLAGKPIDLDARCDVYALGVLLYKLVTGKHPYVFGLPPDEIATIIREGSPPRPSLENPQARGDLELIILKAMAGDRTRRYSSAGSLARDIMRLLSNQPIKARRASWPYRAGLLARRHRPALAAGVIVILVLAVGAAVIAVERVRVHQQRRQADADNAALREAEEAFRRRQLDSANPRSSTVPPAPAVFAAHTGRITALEFIPAADGSLILASAAYDRTVRLWNASDQGTVAPAIDMQAPPTRLASSSHGAVLAVAAAAGPISLFEAATGKHLETVWQRAGSWASLALNTDASMLACAGDDLAVRTIRTGWKTGHDAEALLTLRSTTGAFTSLDFSEDGALLAAGSAGGAVSVWNLADGLLVRRFADLDGGEIAAIGFGSTRQDGLVEIVALTSSGEAFVLPLDEEVQPSSFNALSGSRDHSNPSSLMCAAFNAAGTRLAVGVPGRIIMWNLASSPVVTIGPIALTEMPYALAIDPAGERCAVGFINGTIELHALREPQQR